MKGLLRIPASQSKAVMTSARIREFYRKLCAYHGYPETAICLRLIALTAALVKPQTQNGQNLISKPGCGDVLLKK